LTQEYKRWRKCQLLHGTDPTLRDTYLIPRPPTEAKCEIEKIEVKRKIGCSMGPINSRDTFLIPRSQTDAKWEIQKTEVKRDGVEETLMKEKQHQKSKAK